MELYFIRHGNTKIEHNDFFRSHLSNVGIYNTKTLAKSGRIPKPDLILSSPFNRAIDTAEIFADFFDMKYEISGFLAEWNLQSLNLLGDDYSKEEKLGWMDHDLIVKGGESLNQVRDRVLDGTSELIKKRPDRDKILLVCHGTIINMLCSELTGRAAILQDIKSMPYLAYAIIEHDDKGLKVKKDIV